MLYFCKQRTQLKEPISITSIASISALGNSQEEIWNQYLNDQHRIVEKEFSNSKALVAELPKTIQKEIEELQKIPADDEAVSSQQ